MLFLVRAALEVLAEIKADEKIKNTPVIVFQMRWTRGEEKVKKSLALMVFTLRQMTDLSELIETIESLLLSKFLLY